MNQAELDTVQDCPAWQQLQLREQSFLIKPFSFIFRSLQQQGLTEHSVIVTEKRTSAATNVQALASTCKLPYKLKGKK
jgi:hypothetical protein